MNTSFLFKNTLKFAFVASALFFTSCGEDNTILDTTDEDLNNPEIAKVIVNSTNASNTKETQYSTTAPAGETVNVIVDFAVEASSRNMERLYITKTELNSTEGPVPYDITLDGVIQGISTHSDGSIRLKDDHKEAFSFSLDLPAPDTANGTVQYVIWATKQRGDFRDLTNDNVYGDDTPNYAVITIGEGQPVGYVEFTDQLSSDITLEFPYVNKNNVIDGASETFVSIFNGENYALDNGVETAALWDFGYHYGSTGKASFYSTHSYNNTFSFWSNATNTNLSLVDYVNTSSSNTSVLAKAELNHFYFATSTMDFDAVSSASDLDNITQPVNEFITKMEQGSVIEFVDQYGNKGLIRIDEIKGTNAGTANNPDYIKISVKAQSKVIPLLQ